jgi:hypothetical protein
VCRYCIKMPESLTNSDLIHAGRAAGLTLASGWFLMSAEEVWPAIERDEPCDESFKFEGQRSMRRAIQLETGLSMTRDGSSSFSYSFAH